MGKCSIKEAYVAVSGGEAYIDLNVLNKDKSLDDLIVK